MLVARSKGIDLTATGSGNTGATNVYRIMGKSYGIFVFLMDFLKGMIPVSLAMNNLHSPILIMLCGAAAIGGHMFSPFLNFKGGKGVATGLGVVFAIAPFLFLLSFVLGIFIIVLTGYVSLASVTGSILLAMLMFTTDKPAAFSWGILLLVIMIIYKHIPNIKRLIKGTENKISWKN